jgi:hypothetical protein
LSEKAKYFFVFGLYVALCAIRRFADLVLDLLDDLVVVDDVVLVLRTRRQVEEDVVPLFAATSPARAPAAACC